MILTPYRRLFHTAYLVFIFFLFYQIPTSYANIRQFETTRLKSTAGTGVGSVLMNEAVVLNPAPLGFFNFSTLYLQKESLELKNSAPDQNSVNTEAYSDSSDAINFIAADAKRENKGALSYLHQTEGNWRRKRFSAAFAKPLGENSALGMTYNYTKEENDELGIDKQNYHHTNFGAIHAIEPNFTLGVVVIDPFKAGADFTRIITGVQYVAKNILTVMFDIGTDYTSDKLSDSLLYRAAAQANFISDLYVRAGFFVDKGIGERGNGIGLGWAGPRLVMDLSLKYARPLTDDAKYLTANESIKETSFALTLRF